MARNDIRLVVKLRSTAGKYDPVVRRDVDFRENR